MKKSAVAILAFSTFFMFSPILSATENEDVFLVGDNTSSVPHELFSLGDALIFVYDDGIHGRELWRTDLTTGESHIIKDINPGSDESYIYELTEYQDKLYFAADDGVHGIELWVTDGTEAGTYIFMNIEERYGSSGPSHLKIINDRLLFTVYDSVDYRYVLYSVAGTEEGATLIDKNEIGNAYNFHYAVELNGYLYFISNDTALLRTDGTNDGTTVIKTIPDGQLYPYQLYSDGRKIYFYSNGEPLTGAEPWVSDGTESGTRLLKDMITGPANSPGNDFISYNGKVYFVGTDGSKKAIYETDGTEEGTIPFMEISSESDIYEFTVYDNILYFVYYDGAGNWSYNLWRTDGTLENTYLVEDFQNKYSEFNSYSSSLFPAESGLYFYTAFYVDENIISIDLYRTSGEVRNSELISSKIPVGEGPFLRSLYEKNNEIYFLEADLNQEDFSYTDFKIVKYTPSDSAAEEETNDDEASDKDGITNIYTTDSEILLKFEDIGNDDSADERMPEDEEDTDEVVAEDEEVRTTTKEGSSSSLLKYVIISVGLLTFSFIVFMLVRRRKGNQDN